MKEQIIPSLNQFTQDIEVGKSLHLFNILYMIFIQNPYEGS